MKKLNSILFITILSIFSIVNAQSLNIPPASPSQMLTQQFATSNIEISYSRPAARERVVFGEVVPFDKLWRTGANSATTIAFGEDVTIDGKNIEKGKYGLLTIPGKTNWTIIITKDTNVTSERAYKQANDVLRVTVPVKSLNQHVENFTISVENIQKEQADIVLSWEKTLVSFTVKTEVDSKIMAEIAEVLEKDNRPYFAAARYFYDNDKDLNKALEWVNKAVEQRPDAFWMTHQKAKILMKLKKYNEAIAAAEVSKKQAAAIDYAEYVKLNDNLIAEIKSQPGFKPSKKK